MPNPLSPWPSVTQVIEEEKLGRYSFSNLPAPVLEKAGERGTRIHALAGWSLTGMDGGSPFLPPDELGYFEALQLAIKEKSIGEALLSEHYMECPDLKLNGTLDALVRTVDGPTLLDIKSGEPKGKHPNGYPYDYHPSVGLQTAGYECLLRNDPVFLTATYYGEYLTNLKRRALYLRSNGTYRWIHLDSGGDRATFLAALHTVNYRWRYTR